MAKILIIDDEADVVEFQKSFLMRRRYQVLTAENTPEAIEAITKESLDLVFCDLRIEKDDSGLGIIEQAKKIKPALIIYLITGIIDKEIEARALSLGAREILHKPLSNEELEQKIKEALPE